MRQIRFLAIACFSLVLASVIADRRVFGVAPSEPAAATVHGTMDDLAALARQVRSSVVQVSTRNTASDQTGIEADADPLDGLWRRFFGVVPQADRQFSGRRSSVGSGFIIHRSGTILTNNHVVENGGRITVKLNDQREYAARILGRDPKTDVALIKIEADGDLPELRLGDSDGLEVGEWVIAVGSPFGLENSVSIGIVSATGRAFSARPFNSNSFIQTDASINPGSSGGPLINLNGEVVGINSAIYSRTGANMGINFAISINLVKELLPQLRDTGRVARGWLGVAAEPLTPELAEFLGMPPSGGALVSGLQQNSPAAQAGVKLGDVIVGFDGVLIYEPSQLVTLVAQMPAGRRANAKILRDGKELTLSLVVALPKDEQSHAAATAERQSFGVTVERVTAQIARQKGLHKAQGVMISAVDSSGTAADAGLRAGDLILEIDRRAIRNVVEFDNLINRSSKRMLFLIRRGEDNHFVAFAPHPEPPHRLETAR
jgi:serine protease Do